MKLDPAEIVPLVAPLFDIPIPKDRILIVAPDELRRRQLEVLTNWAIAGAQDQPLVLVFQDLHWADPTTLEVLRAIAERGALASLFVLATTQPEFKPPWATRSHHGVISLAPLDRQQVRQMVAELAARGITDRTGGVPLFIEEVTRLLLERGQRGGIQTIPPTLQQSLLARLDQLGAAREVAQIGAVIGRGFTYPLLRAVAGMEDAPLQAALECLADADIVLVEGLPPAAEYRFKHALIQDAAYEISVEEQAADHPSPSCRDFGREVSGDRGHSTRPARSSLLGSWSDRGKRSLFESQSTPTTFCLSSGGGFERDWAELAAEAEHAMAGVDDPTWTDLNSRRSVAALCHSIDRGD